MNLPAIQLQNTTAQFFVKVTQGSNKGDVYRISPPGVILGRDPLKSQIALNDVRVSRQQCRIDFYDQAISIEDLSGKGTTLLNNEPITNHELKHGDIITLGDTVLVFEVTSAASPQKLSVVPKGSGNPSLNGMPTGSPMGSAINKGLDPQKKRLFIIGGLGAALFLGLALYPEAPPQALPQVASGETVNTAIEEVQKRQTEIQEKKGNYTDQDLYNQRSAEKHFIRGFRDYQNGRYGRAIEAFQTTLATYPKHPTARRYYQLSQKKRQEQVDHHMDLGSKYREKGMYKLCIAEFEKVMQILNQPSHKKYQLAKEQVKECRLSLQGRY